jgi:hypothetical protein
LRRGWPAEEVLRLGGTISVAVGEAVAVEAVAVEAVVVEVVVVEAAVAKPEAVWVAAASVLAGAKRCGVVLGKDRIARVA